MRWSALILVVRLAREEVTRTRVSKIIHCGLISLLFTATLLRGQSATAVDPATTIHVRTQIVSLDVAVVDKKGRPANANLGRDDFLITEDGKPQQLRYFEAPSIHPKPATEVVLDELNTSPDAASFSP